jgi:hypothetical protein
MTKNYRLHWMMTETMILFWKKNKWHLSNSSSTSTHGSLNSSTLTKNKNKKLFKSTNRFELLSPNEPPEESLMNDVFIDNTSNSHNTHNDTPKPPPTIFVRGVIVYTEVCTKLIDLIGVDSFSVNPLQIG